MQGIDIVWVGLGGGLGSLLRWYVGKRVGEHFHGSFPLATFLINISGAFVIGFLSVYFSVHWQDRYGSMLNAGVLTGILGGYTTFSTLMLDVLKLHDGKKRVLAWFYLVLSVLVGLVCAWLGASLAHA